MAKNNWYVVTGTTCSGKTTTLEILEKKGFKVVHEAARTFIDEQIAKGKTINEIREDEGKFQKKILDFKIRIEKKLPRKELIILDRGIPDSIAYFEVAGLSPEDSKLRDAVKNSYYKKVFLLEQLEFDQDYARTDGHNAKRIQDLLEKCYKKEGYEVIKIPAIVDREKRAEMIIANL